MLNKIAESAVKSAMKAAIKQTLKSMNKGAMRPGDAINITFEADAVARKKGALAWTEGYTIVAAGKVFYKAWRYYPLDPHKFECAMADLKPSAPFIVSMLGGLAKYQCISFRASGHDWEFSTKNLEQFLTSVRA